MKDETEAKIYCTIGIILVIYSFVALFMANDINPLKETFISGKQIFLAMTSVLALVIGFISLLVGTMGLMVTSREEYWNIK